LRIRSFKCGHIILLYIFIHLASSGLISHRSRISSHLIRYTNSGSINVLYSYVLFIPITICIKLAVQRYKTNSNIMYLTHVFHSPVIICIMRLPNMSRYSTQIIFILYALLYYSGVALYQPTAVATPFACADNIKIVLLLMLTMYFWSLHTINHINNNNNNNNNNN